MNSTADVHSSGVIQSTGNRSDQKMSAARQKQYEVLARLEAKYGASKLRIDAGHHTPNAPHTRAAKFRHYTDWLTQLTASAESTDPNSSVIEPAKPTTPNLEHASPDILATPILNTTDSNTATTESKLTDSRVGRSSQRPGLSMPVDESGLSLDRLQRIDLAHANTRKAQSRRPKAKSAKKPGYDLPAKTVAWEVEDFTWPIVIDQSNLLKTKTATIMAEAANMSLSATEQRLAVMGSGRGPGTTTISMFVARILAARNKKVLLVDADLAKPDLTNRLGLPANLSWMNVINENQKCSDAIVRSIDTGICVMPVSKLAARVTWPDYIYDCLSGILDAVRRHFDVVIIDVGPSSQLIRELSRPNLLVDTAMLVHNVRIPDRSLYVRNQNELNSFGIKKLVVAENFAAGKAA